ncbi:flagellar hook-basal body complex protein [Cytobacillus massiliigabonensis]|uniref:flagellar hook-basal body complex protein n=1 Tax=Cytobacillus massiliigabonensis TaxID=1871011 RepID=UPI000C8343CD|nr:flagellar hook-basal body complex protein [Cytobacillus massiliigabonensis]
MLRSMYSGISGMKNFQTKLDVIGNNIANVNTFGFKKGRVTFQDMMNQQISGATAPGQGRGGVNPKQVGLGSTIATIDTIHTQGSLQTTARSLDLALSGDGFFMVGAISDLSKVGIDQLGAAGNNKINGPINNSIALNYTRAGNFYMDEDGYIVNANGLYAIGQTGEKSIPTNQNIKDADTALGAAGKFEDDMKKFIDNTKKFYNAIDNLLQARQAYDAALASSNNNTADPEVVTADKILDAAITELGKITYDVTTINSSITTLNKAIEAFNTASQDTSTKTLPEGILAAVNAPTKTNTAGEIKDTLSKIQSALNYMGKAQSTHKSFVTAAEMFKEPSWTDSLSDSAGIIQLPKTAKSFSIGADGTVTFVDQRGDLRVAGKLMVAKFENSGGLQKVGDNLFQETTNSGSLDKDGNGITLDELYSPGEKGAAVVASGSLEMSNVDLSEEFTEMITAQRGFQANTRIITTSDEILQELVNLKR